MTYITLIGIVYAKYSSLNVNAIDSTKQSRMTHPVVKLFVQLQINHLIKHEMIQRICAKCRSCQEIVVNQIVATYACFHDIFDVMDHFHK